MDRTMSAEICAGAGAVVSGIAMFAQAVSGNGKGIVDRLADQGPMGVVCVLCIGAVIWLAQRREADTAKHLADRDADSKAHHAERDRREEKLVHLIETHTLTAHEASEAYKESRKVTEELVKTIAGCPNRK